MRLLRPLHKMPPPFPLLIPPFLCWFWMSTNRQTSTMLPVIFYMVHTNSSRTIMELTIRSAPAAIVGTTSSRLLFVQTEQLESTLSIPRLTATQVNIILLLLRRVHIERFEIVCRERIRSHRTTTAQVSLVPSLLHFQFLSLFTLVKSTEICI